MTERMLSQVHSAEIGFLRGVHGMKFRNEVHSCEIREDFIVKPLFLRIERSQSHWFGHVSGISFKEGRGKFCWVHLLESAHSSSKEQVAWLHLRPCLVPSWCWANRTTWGCCWAWDVSSPSRAAASLPSWEEKWVWKMNEWLAIKEDCYLSSTYSLKDRSVLKCLAFEAVSTITRRSIALESQWRRHKVRIFLSVLINKKQVKLKLKFCHESQ